MENNIIIGRNAVLEALRAGVTIDKVYIAKGEVDGALGHIAAYARQAGAVVVEADRRKLDALCSDAGRASQEDGKASQGEAWASHGGFVHQGVVAVASAAAYSTIEEIIDCANEAGRKPLIIICDEISDPHNLGAIIRTAAAAGASGVIIPKRRNAGLSPIVAKASSGAVFHIKVARATNITAAVRELKKSGIWVFGACADGDTVLWESDLRDAAAIVIGSEGKGLSRLVRENCDFTVSIPMDGKLTSLNASVSASILLYEAYRQRRNIGT